MAKRTGKNSKSGTRPRKTAASKTPRRKARRGRPRKSARIEVRVSAEHKELIERASILKGATFSSFVAETLVEAARHAIDEEHTWRLNAEQSARLSEMLMNPAEPEEALKDLFEGYFAGRRKPGF